MNENRAMLKFDFSYTNEFGCESRMINTTTTDCLEDMDEAYVLASELKKFMIACGFNENVVKEVFNEE